MCGCKIYLHQCEKHNGMENEIRDLWMCCVLLSAAMALSLTVWIQRTFAQGPFQL